MITAIISFVMGFLYRLRGGGYLTLDSDVDCRLIWATTMAMAFAAQNGVHIWPIIAVFMASFLSMSVPHAYCQNMGRWSVPQRKWPSFFFPAWTDAGWTAAPLWQRALYDAGQMGMVGFWRGLIVFGSVFLINALNLGTGTAFINLVCGVGAITLLQPIGYLIGCYVMWFNAPSLTKFSPTWGEFWNGVGWGLAVAVAAV